MYIMEIIQIYCGIKYADKDTAKSHGAKWNNKDKKWYFEFNLNEFLRDETKHTRQFNHIELIISILMTILKIHLSHRISYKIYIFKQFKEEIKNSLQKIRLLI